MHFLLKNAKITPNVIPRPDRFPIMPTTTGLLKYKIETENRYSN